MEVPRRPKTTKSIGLQREQRKETESPSTGDLCDGGDIISGTEKSADGSFQSKSNCSSNMMTGYPADDRLLDSRREQPVEGTSFGTLEQPNKRLSLSFGSFRRHKEELILSEAYNAVLDSGAKSLVLVSGPSGCGKTSLATSLKKTVTGQGGYFLTGKFDQLMRAEPYAAFVSAFTEFTSAVIARGETAKEEMGSAIHAAVGDEAAVLVEMIPSLACILGHNEYSTTNCKAKANDAIQRFVFLFRMFLRAVSSLKHPVVLLLDDLQWADPCSLDLLKSIVADSSNNGLVVIGTCEADVSPDSDLSAKLREMEANEKTDIVDIPIDDLSSDAVEDLLLRVLDTSPQDSGQLAELVTLQTNGNPFYMMWFIQWLVQSGLYLYSANGSVVKSDGQLRWDLEAVRQAVEPREVTEFLGYRLEQEFGHDTREVLKVAACLGFHVEEELIEYVLGRPVAQNANEALVKGAFISDEARDRYAFAHDDVQKAAYRMIPEDERELFHVEVGRRLWRELESDSLDRHIFVLLSQFMIGKRLISREKERYAVASLCLHAGTKAAKSPTFRTAAVYLNLGIDLVGERGWRDEYGLTLALHNAGAEMNMCTGNFKRMHELIEAVLLRARTPLDKVQANSTWIYVLGSQDEQHKAIDLGLLVLKDLGEHFPSRPCRTHLRSEFRSVRKLLRGKSDEQLLRMPPLEDPTKMACLQVLQLMFLSCLFVRPELAPFVSLRSTRITLLCGLSPMASLAFTCYGLACLGSGDVDRAVRFGQLGLKLLDSFGATEYVPRVYAAYYGVIHSWRFPISDALEPLLRAHRVGLQTGDYEFAHLCSNSYCFLSVVAGVSIDEVMSHWSTFELSMSNLNRKMMLRLSLPFIQTISFYLNTAEEPLSFKGEIVDILEEERRNFESGRTNQALFTRLVRMEIAYVFGAYEVAHNLSGTLLHSDLMVPTVEIANFHFFRGMISLAMTRTAKDTRKHIRIAKKTIDMFKPWSAKSPHNLLDRLCLMEGELASVCSRADEAYSKYTCAIAIAKDSGNVYLHALANERVGHHFLSLRQKETAESFFRRACLVYGEWGGKAKVRHLEAELELIFPSM